MDTGRFARRSPTQWVIEPFGTMRVPAVIYADEALIIAMDEKVYEQVTNVATLPGIVKASYAMPDAHWGYGFPIGGVAAFDPDEGGVVSAGGVGFDISCGVRCLRTGLQRDAIELVKATVVRYLCTMKELAENDHAFLEATNAFPGVNAHRGMLERLCCPRLIWPPETDH
jgi:hypothetical protein